MKRTLKIVITIGMIYALIPIAFLFARDNKPVKKITGVWMLARTKYDGRYLADNRDKVMFEFMEDGKGRIVWENDKSEWEMKRFTWIIENSSLKIQAERDNITQFKKPFMINFKENNSQIFLENEDYTFVIDRSSALLPPDEMTKFQKKMTKEDIDLARRLAGTWSPVLQDPNSDSDHLDFVNHWYVYYNDGRYKKIIQFGGNLEGTVIVYTIEGEWVINGNVLRLFQMSDKEFYFIELSGDNNELSMNQKGVDNQYNLYHRVEDLKL
ncbi:MAG: hypothetical protein JW969_09605 [Spirochaetales bacterium]|nr:hypothetical protein [Spirochaetales bacterium]